LERILCPENLRQAWLRVKANGGAAGVDGMTIAQFPAFARQYWQEIRARLLALQAYREIPEMDQWLRRRVRIVHWKQWKRARNRRRQLIRLGIHPAEVYKATRSHRGYWWMAGPASSSAR